jgi:ribose transport system ATP-binding protein
VTVLRSGKTVARATAVEASPYRLVALMAGKSDPGAVAEPVAKEQRPKVARRRVADAEPVLRTHELVLREGAEAIELDVKPGEVLGIAGLEGHGQDVLLRCLVGQEKPASGSVEAVGDKGAARVTGPHNALRAGIAYVPADRKREAIFAPLSVLDNLMLPTLGRSSVAGVMRFRQVKKRARALIERLDVRPARFDTTAGRLSGGNQQKLVLGRWLAADPKVLVLNDPLRGVDLGARREVCALFRELAAEGIAVVFFSTEIEELLMTCDAVAVLREQSVERIVEGEELDQHTIVNAMFGQAPSAAAAAGAPEAGREARS